MLPSDGGGRYAGPEHIEPWRLQTLLHYLIIFCKIYSATEGINTEFITFPCKYEHGEGGREDFRHSCTTAGLGRMCYGRRWTWTKPLGQSPQVQLPRLCLPENTDPDTPLPPRADEGLSRAPSDTGAWASQDRGSRDAPLARALTCMPAGSRMAKAGLLFHTGLVSLVRTKQQG